jgi:hypothetical protein
VDAGQLVRGSVVRFLRARNQQGYDIYLLPYAEQCNAGYILIDLDHYLPGWYEDSWGDRIKEDCFRRRSAQASSIKIRASQLRKAPSLSKLGGLREAAALQFRTAYSASS